jgi:hypothetical protein
LAFQPEVLISQPTHQEPIAFQQRFHPAQRSDQRQKVSIVILHRSQAYEVLYELLYEFYGFEELKRPDKMRSIKATAVSQQKPQRL